MNEEGNWMTAALPFVIILAVLVLRFRSMSRERPLKPGTFWVVPVVYLLLVGSMLYSVTPSPAGWGLLLLGLAIGAGIGWRRGKLILISRDQQSGEFRQRASPLAMLLLVVLVALKLGAREIFGDSAAGHPGSSAMLLTDAFLGFALGLLTATRLEIFLRVRRIVTDGR